MHRRTFLVSSLVGLAAPFVEAQQSAVFRIALVHPSLPVTAMTESGARGAFFGELRQRGYVEGRNLVVDRWSGEGKSERFPRLAVQIAESAPNVVVVNGVALAQEIKAASRGVPILVMAFDPVADGLVSNVAKPEANVTGVALAAGSEVLGKHIELLSDAVPAGARVAFLARSNAPGLSRFLDDSRRRGFTVQHVVMDGPFHERQYVEAFEAMSRGRVQGVVVFDQVSISPMLGSSAHWLSRIDCR